MNEKTRQQLQRLEQQLPDYAAQMPEDRRVFFEGLRALAQGDVDEAMAHFKSANRGCDPPFDHLSLFALASCDRITGKDGRALRRLKAIIDDEALDPSTRITALTMQLDIYTTRDDERMIASTQDALERITAQG